MLGTATFLEECGGSRSENYTEMVREELHSLKISALEKRAGAAGVSEDVLEEAEDEDDYKTAVIELIVQAEREGARAER